MIQIFRNFYYIQLLHICSRNVYLKSYDITLNFINLAIYFIYNNISYILGITNKNKSTRQRQYRSTITTPEQVASISDDAKLSLPTTNESDNPDLLMNLNAPSKNVIDVGEKDALTTSNEDKNEAPSHKADHVNDQNNVNLDNGISSKDAESVIEKQKRIEEENKRKKAAIAKALEDRYILSLIFNIG